MIRRPPRSTRTDTRFPYTTLFRSVVVRRHAFGVDRDIGISGLQEIGTRKLWRSCRCRATEDLQVIFLVGDRAEGEFVAEARGAHRELRLELEHRAELDRTVSGDDPALAPSQPHRERERLGE